VGLPSTMPSVGILRPSVPSLFSTPILIWPGRSVRDLYLNSMHPDSKYNATWKVFVSSSKGAFSGTSVHWVTNLSGMSITYLWVMLPPSFGMRSVQRGAIMLFGASGFGNDLVEVELQSGQPPSPSPNDRNPFDEMKVLV